MEEGESRYTPAALQLAEGQDVESNGVGWRGVVLVGFVSAAVGAGVAIALSRSENESMRRELASLAHRLSRQEAAPIDRPPQKLLRAERIEVVAPDGTPRVTVAGGADSASVVLHYGTQSVTLSAAGTESLVLIGADDASANVRLLVDRSEALAISSVLVSSYGSDPNSASSVRLSTKSIGRGRPRIELENGRPWTPEGLAAARDTQADDLIAGRPPRSSRFSVGISPVTDDCELSLADTKGRTRLTAVVGETETPRLTFMDADGRTRLALGRTGLKGTLGSFETPEDTIVSFGEDGMVKWREPR